MFTLSILFKPFRRVQLKETQLLLLETASEAASMRIGKTVRMTQGPFLGMRGTVVRSHRRRVVLAVLLGNSEVQIEVERDWIQAAVPRRRSASHLENPKLVQRAAG